MMPIVVPKQNYWNVCTAIDKTTAPGLVSTDAVPDRLSFATMPKQIHDIRDFLQKARRTDARHVTIRKKKVRRILKTPMVQNTAIL